MSEPIQSSLISSAQAIKNAAETKGVVKILEAPPDTRPDQKFRGEVVRTEKNGDIVIKVDNGTIRIKPENMIKLQNGAPVELTLNKASDLARLRALQNLAQQATPQAVDTSTLKASQSIVQSLQSLIQSSAIIPLESFPPAKVPTLTAPYVEPTLSTLTTLQPQSISLQAPIESNTLFALPVHSADPLLLIGDQVPKNSLLISETSFKPITTDFPFKALAARLISSPLKEPLTIPVHQTKPSELTILKTATITETDPPRISVNTHEEQDALLTKTIGETQARLVGFTAERQLPVFKLVGEEAYYTLRQPIENIPIDTKITLESKDITRITLPHTNAPPPSTSSIIPALSHSTYLTPDLWNVLQQISTTLLQSSPQIAQNMHASIPNAATPQQIGAAALFFLAAIRAGDVQNWLGEKAIQTLQQLGKSDLLTRLGQEFTGLSRVNVESASQEWRIMNLPLLWQEDIHRVVIHYRKEENQHEEATQGGTQTRFVMDLNLSNIGKLQLDGLFRDIPQTGKRLDLILRTTQSFSSPMKAEMRRAYKDALDDTFITGELSFQDSPEHWVHISADAQSRYEENI